MRIKIKARNRLEYSRRCVAWTQPPSRIESANIWGDECQNGGKILITWYNATSRGLGGILDGSESEAKTANTSHSPFAHLPLYTFFAPQICFNFSVVSRQVKDNAYADFGRQTRCIMEDVQKANKKSIYVLLVSGTLSRLFLPIYFIKRRPLFPTPEVEFLGSLSKFIKGNKS